MALFKVTEEITINGKSVEITFKTLVEAGSAEEAAAFVENNGDIVSDDFYGYPEDTDITDEIVWMHEYQAKEV